MFFLSKKPEDTYKARGMKAVRQFMKKKQYELALKGCDELLHVFPLDYDCFKIRNKVYSLWKKARYQKVKIALKEANHLWKEKKHEELEKIFLALNEYLPETEEVEQGLLTLRKKREEKRQDMLHDRVKKGLAYVRELERSGDLKEAFEFCGRLAKALPYEKNISECFSRISKLYVNSELEKRSSYLQARRFQDLLHLYSELLHILPNYSKIHRLIHECEQCISEQKRHEQAAFIHSSYDRARRLYREDKFSEAIRTCEEILHADPKNFLVKWWLMKAKFHDKRSMEYELADKMIRSWKKMETGKNGLYGLKSAEHPIFLKQENFESHDIIRL
ncbi:hypothetical protein HYV57_04410 [Candidatus Peregrinibacteria bacterium]|nr:hypothetical protein [Candidatus Peregrinibacteria bacterium]